MSGACCSTALEEIANAGQGGDGLGVGTTGTDVEVCSLAEEARKVTVPDSRPGGETPARRGHRPGTVNRPAGVKVSSTDRTVLPSDHRRSPGAWPRSCRYRCSSATLKITLRAPDVDPQGTRAPSWPGQQPFAWQTRSTGGATARRGDGARSAGCSGKMMSARSAPILARW